MEENKNRVCPICGLELGQKNICPVCSGKAPADGTENASSAETPDTAAPATRVEQYRQLEASIIEVRNDFAAVKARVEMLLEQFPDFFEFDSENFYYRMIHDGCPLAVFAVLMNERWCSCYRKRVWIGYDKHYCYDKLYNFFESSSPGSVLINMQSDDLPPCLLRLMCEKRAPFFISYTFESGSNPFVIYLHGYDFSSYEREYEYIKVVYDKFNRHSGNWWRLVPPGKRVLILYCGEYLQIRNAAAQADQTGTTDDEYAAPEQLALFDGLEYRCTLESNYGPYVSLVYMVDPL